MSDIAESTYDKIKVSVSLNKLVVLVFLFVIIYFGYERYAVHNEEQVEATTLVLAPKINDIYFLDLRVKNENYESKKKYQLAKVVAIRGDNITLVYGRFFYQWQYSVVNSIQYGDLGNSDYFATKLDIFSLKEIKNMRNSREIYLAKRPIQNQLYGTVISR